MKFDKSRVYTAVNADELKAGDKVIVADATAVRAAWRSKTWQKKYSC